ncbi:hypothetical protein QMK17_10125 [Rhodococcus sp. G-MC3]|uniref:hypothetical protein n=1 Tax=Rhodococcus sp. G-MC3 TaxID=3046209 RepID=UPI0024B9F26C|nr:hypothetical protein [Rhodococcus sp. G-MC3]MDJ0393686.1 hypothetical protein [Rhodococcus sp. G-MC3]
MNSEAQADAEEARAFRRGDAVTAVRHLGKRAWRAGIPAGTGGVVVDIDWLGDLRVEFTVGGDWLQGRCTVQKVVAVCDLQLIRRAEHRLTGT